MKRIIGFLIGILPLFLAFGCTAKAQTQSSEQGGIFADVISFDGYDAMQKFISEKGLNEVYACSDGVGDVKLILVAPASDEIKLELYRAVTDKYGNVEPDYDIQLSNCQVGQPLYFATNPVDRKVPLVVVAVDGVGHRSYWSPTFNADGKLGVNEDFGCFTSKTEKAESNKIDKVIDYKDYGIKFMVKDTKAFMEVYDIDKYLKNRLWTPTITPLKNGTYEITNIDGDCQGLFIGNIGQDINPVLCILLYDNTVELMSVQKSIDNGLLMSSGRIKGLWDVEGFENSGGGAYEYEGKTMYSYITIYCIDSGKHKNEVELFYYGVDYPYQSSDGQKLLMLEDFTMSYTDNNYEYRGIFRADSVDEEKSLCNISYRLLKQRDLSSADNAFADVEIEGSFKLDRSDYYKMIVTPVTGLDFGTQIGVPITFNNESNK